MFKEFGKFIMRGNVLDLAVGIIIGAAFTSIVNSLVNDVLMPPIGFIIGGIDFSEIVITLQEAQGDTPAVTINIGMFINAVFQFAIVAFVVFMIVRTFNRAIERMQRKEKAEEAAAPAPEPTPDPVIETQKALISAIEKLNSTLEKKA